MEKQRLKESLLKIRSNDFLLMENDRHTNYIESMIEHIGDPDPELRDDLVYMTFANWIDRYKLLEKSELEKLLTKLSSEEYLFIKIGSIGEDSVLKRSFSALVISFIIWAHVDEPFLDNTTVICLKDKLIKYFDEELDLRGYDYKKGWIHSVAHTADSFIAILCCEELNDEMRLEVLDCIQRKLLQGNEFFSTNEDERIASVIVEGLLEDNLLSEEVIVDWIESFKKVLDIEDSMQRLKAKINTKNFIRSLYFRLVHNGDNKRVSDALLAIEKELNNFLE